MSYSNKTLNEELEKACRQIEQAHLEWMTALDSMEDLIFLHDREFRILRANRAYQRLAGIPFRDIIGRPYFEIFPKTQGPLPGCLSLMETQEKAGEEEFDVGGRTYSSRAFPMHDEQGGYLFSLHSFTDITERKGAEKSIRAAKDLLQSVVENAPVRVFWKDRELNYLGCNSAFAKDAGFSAPDEVIGKDDYQMGWSEQAELYRTDDKRVMDSDTPKLGYEEPQTTPDGHMIWLRTSKVPLHDAEGKVFGMVGLYEDITERKLAEQHLMKNEAMLTEMGKMAKIGGWEFDAATGKGTWTEEVARIYDMNPEEATNREIGLSLFQGESRQRIEAAINAAIADGTPYDLELEMVTAKGNRKWVRTIAQPVLEGGKVVRLGGSFQDITERKQNAISMQRANRALRTISAGNEVLIHATDEKSLLNQMCHVVVEIGGYRMAWVGYTEEDAAKTVRLMTYFGCEEGYLESAHISWADVERGRGPIGRAIRSGQKQVVQNILTDPSMAPWRLEAERLGYAACIALPLCEKGKCFGALTIYDSEPEALDPDEVKLLQEMADDLAFGIITLRVRKAHREHEQRLQKNMLQTVEAIASIVEMRDPYTSGHQIRVAEVAREIARVMGMTEEEVQVIHLAGLVHDLGKIQVPAEILSKPRRLNDLEYNLIKTHAQAGYDILKGIDFSWPIAQMVLQHHERLDGSGYPQGLKGEQILLGARILSVADVVEAMSSHRPYRPGLGIDAALDEVSRQRGLLFDAQVVDACLTLFRERGYQLPS